MTVRIAMPIVNEKKTLKMPSLLAFLPMFGRTNESFEVSTLQREEEEQSKWPWAVHEQHHCICTVEYAKWVYRRVSARKKLVGTDDELRQELVGQGVEVSSVKLGVRSSLEVGFMLDHMILHFRHGITDSDIVVEELTMSSCIPFSERGKLLGDGVEETNDDTDWGSFHVVAELVNSSRIGNTVVAIELHLFPDSKEDGGKHEDRGPVFEPVTTVHAGVKRRQFFEDLLLQLAPHIGQSTLDLEVDHHWCNDLSVELGVFILNQAIHGVLISSLFYHRDVKGQVVCKD